MKLLCYYCLYEWDYKGWANYREFTDLKDATCPRCRRKVNKEIGEL